MHTWKRLFLAAVLLPTMWLAAHSLFVLYDGLHDRVAPVDAAVVFGNRVELSGHPSPRLQHRLDKALEVYRQGLSPVIIVSGGLGREGYEEADVMRDYLVAHGVPAEAIIVDRRGYDTYSTVLNTQRIMRERGMHSVLAISQYFHMSRIKLAFARAGVSRLYTAHAKVMIDGQDLPSLWREFVAYYYYLLRPFPDS